MKLKVKLIQDRLQLVENEKKLLEANYRVVVQRLSLLEEGSSRREEDLKIVREVFDYDTSTRTRIKLLKVLSPEAEDEPLLLLFLDSNSQDRNLGAQLPAASYL